MVKKRVKQKWVKIKKINNLNSFLIAGLVVILIFLVFILQSFKQLIYPPLHRDLPSPKTFLEKNPAKLISTSSAIVYEHGPRDNLMRT